MGSIEEIAGVVFPLGNVVVAGNIFGYARQRARRVGAVYWHGRLMASVFRAVVFVCFLPVAGVDLRYRPV